MSDTEGVEPPTKRFAQQPNRGGRRQRNRGKASEAKRTDQFRTKQNAKLVSVPNALSKGRATMDAKYMNIGLDLPELTPKVVQAAQAAAVPISLRGAGVAVALSYGKAVSLAPPKVLGLCTIHQAYRAALLQMWLKLHVSQETVPYSTLRMPVHVDYHMPEDLRSLVSDYPQAFALMSNMLSGIGWFQVGSEQFRTYVPEVVGVDAFGVYPQNLRRTLESYQEAEPDAAERFRLSSTVPGIVFDAEGFIVNIDDIAPIGWPNRALCRRDLDAYAGLLTFLKGKYGLVSVLIADIRHQTILTFEKGKYGLVSDVSYENKAVPLSLVRREILDPGDSGSVQHVGHSYDFTIGHAEQWFSRVSLDSHTWCRGILSLLGDMPPIPVVSTQNACYSLVADWSDLATSALRPRS